MQPLKLLRKIIVVVIALPVLIFGVILIPLPGPGLLVCLLGLVILSLEFETAKKYRDEILKKIKSIFNEARNRK